MTALIELGLASHALAFISILMESWKHWMWPPV